MRRGICQECKFENDQTKAVTKMYKLAKLEILVRRAGRKKEKMQRAILKPMVVLRDLEPPRKQDLSGDEGGLV